MTLAFFIEILTSDPVLYISIVVAVIISITLHELGHGVAAISQGDDTPRELGHMTLDPRAHMPPMSWALLLLVGISYGLMPVNPSRFRSKHGDALVSAAGPAVNLLLAFLGFAIWLGWLKYGGIAEPGTTTANFQRFFQIFARFNIVLCIFNMLPIPPLDGSSVLGSFSPAFRQASRDPAKQQLFFGVFLLIFLFGSGYLWAAGYAVEDLAFETVMGYPLPRGLMQ